MLKRCFAIMAVLSLNTHAQAPQDPYLWLEDIEGKASLRWVAQRNAQAEAYFTQDPLYTKLEQDLLAIFDSPARIPTLHRLGAYHYNFWKDAAHPRGLWRRVSLEHFKGESTSWETVLDLDALAQTENENWVWSGVRCLRPPAGEPYQRCMLSLSRGGADAVVLREFDLIDKAFVADGFEAPEAKQDIDWKDIDTLWLASDFGPQSTTTAGYPRMIKAWKRAKEPQTAKLLFEGAQTDVAVSPGSDHQTGQRRDWIYRATGFFQTEHYLWQDDQAVRIDAPLDATLSAFKEWLLIQTRSPWQVAGTTYPAGSLLAANFADYLKGHRRLHVLYRPDAQRALQSLHLTRNAVLLTELDRVRPRLWELTYNPPHWTAQVVDTPPNTAIEVTDTYWDSDRYLLTIESFTQPKTLIARTVGEHSRQTLQTLPAFFDTDGLITEQHEAISQDGTAVPYFIVRHQDSPSDGAQPTLIYAYGGFEHSLLPWYSGAFGKGWLEPGGILVLANVRGGGEFGPAWHQAAQRHNKQRSWDDVAAVAQDLIERDITSPKHLGILGGSQGGLLVSTVLVQHPTLFGAAVSQVPLTDMLRYHKLLAGASWIDEYGNPDNPTDRAYLAKYSPYQNVSATAEYPPLFLTTSTRDDRVHPGHARKMAARMLDQGHRVLYFENTEGGHGAAANNAQAARLWAQSFTFLWRALRPSSHDQRAH